MRFLRRRKNRPLTSSLWASAAARATSCSSATRRRRCSKTRRCRSYSLRPKEPAKIAVLEGRVAAGRATLQVDGRQELLTGHYLGPECSQHTAGYHRHVGFMYSSGGHAFVRGFYHHAHSKRLEYAVEARGDLGGHFLLNLKPFRIDVHETDKLGNSHNPLARQIADVNAADDRRYVVFAMRFEPDVAQQDDLVVAGDFFAGPLQVLARIFEITCKPFLVCARDTRRGADTSFAVGIIAGPTNERAYRLFCLGARRPNAGDLSRTSFFDAMIELYALVHLIFPAPRCPERYGPLAVAFPAYGSAAQGIPMLSFSLPVAAKLAKRIRTREPLRRQSSGVGAIAAPIGKLVERERERTAGGIGPRQTLLGHKRLEIAEASVFVALQPHAASAPHFRNLI